VLTSAADSRVADARVRLAAAQRRRIGFPVATDIDYSPVSWVHDGFLNNIGSPEIEGRWPSHTKDVERDVIARFIQMFGGTPARSWGYITGNGSSEGVMHGMWLGRERFPNAWVYYSRAAHYCVAKAARILGVPGTSIVDVDDGGQMLYEDLGSAAARHRDRPALIVLTAGTTMTEAVDDVASVHEVLDEAGITRRHIVVDAALSGPALAADGTAVAHLLGEYGAGLGRADADAVCVSGHKSFGTPHVCGVVVTRREHVTRVTRAVEYIADTDATVAGSRSGQAPVELWHGMNVIGGITALRHRATAAREVAQHTVDQLNTLGWPAWRHPHAWTVVFPEPPHALTHRWALATSEGQAHIVCAPGTTRSLIDEFLAELASISQCPPYRHGPQERTA
jgi:histidine decarboxylase